MKVLNIVVVFMLAICLSCNWGYAQKTKKVSGYYKYVLSENDTPAEGREIALQKARKNAIEKEYGTSVSQRDVSQTVVSNGEQSTNFSSVGQSLMRGVWVRNSGEPEFLLGAEHNQFYIECSVRGYAREYKTAPVEFDARLLRNGKTLQFETKDGVFKDGDKFYLSFQSPADGYIAVYWVNSKKEAVCLLPDASDSDGKEFVTHGVRKLFFASQSRVEDEFIVYGNRSDGLIVNCEDKLEQNQLYIIFSPNPFTKANDEKGSDGLRSLPLERFLQWLDTHLNLDNQMSVDNRVIEIQK